MRPLRVEFAPKPSASSWLWVGIGVATLVVAAVQAWHLKDLQTQHRAVAEEANQLSSQLQARSVAPAVPDSQSNSIPAYAEDARAVARMAAFDIDSLLSEIEAVRISGVRVLSVELSAQERVVRVELELNEPSLSLRYLEAINVSEPHPRWQLVRSETTTGAALTSAMIQRRLEPTGR
ncbi:MAG: hypothetical protein JHC40_10405 [Burkholderiales bacterium]|jgi:hypothetical protein|nr:hypothetical protein [Burkholderiales bacterium]